MVRLWTLLLPFCNTQRTIRYWYNNHIYLNVLATVYAIWWGKFHQLDELLWMSPVENNSSSIYGLPPTHTHTTDENTQSVYHTDTLLLTLWVKARKCRVRYKWLLERAVCSVLCDIRLEPGFLHIIHHWAQMYTSLNILLIPNVYLFALSWIMVLVSICKFCAFQEFHLKTHCHF